LTEADAGLGAGSQSAYQKGPVLSRRMSLVTTDLKGAGSVVVLLEIILRRGLGSPGTRYLSEAENRRGKKTGKKKDKKKGRSPPRHRLSLSAQFIGVPEERLTPAEMHVKQEYRVEPDLRQVPPWVETGLKEDQKLIFRAY
jgi:hypothetical protein